MTQSLIHSTWVPKRGKLHKDVDIYCPGKGSCG